ncbi:toll/interleukin-1 receptor domain-containing protein [Actinomadura sp. NAK00032]|uniref:toll/interleukin-1 receptor domain-containing protein n=1 Tax=Actinomadura sp. NAK00032 TaxID=2742128 RepID=UPI001590C7C1|nr:toll/interleukin-1 receptor domain-containing protein [Actinomadura sp. NAK00032]QKW34827.1 toll/interleukin-1 receptor domain-containing protein [Actinomadura sp. NAK00032]
MADVFINYRTVDAAPYAAGAYEFLKERFGEDRVFRDAVSLRPGDHYPVEIRRELESAKILLVLIGPRWFAADGGERLIDREKDWVRREIRAALGAGIAVVPVLLDGAARPAADDLPGDIAGLAHRQSVAVAHPRFGEDLRRLAGLIAEKVPDLLLPDLFEKPPELPDDPLPSMLLRPEYGVVPFGGRTAELDRLRDWLRSPARVDVLLVTGPGGQGKTRLADELVRKAGGWAAGLVPERLPDEVLGRVGEFTTPLLLVVDYAEGRTAQVARLASALLERTAERGPSRMLLLARSAGVWRQFLRRHRDDRVALLFGDMAEMRLGPLTGTDDRRAEFDRALTAFARGLGRPEPLSAPPAGLTGGRCDRALEVHAAALAALLDGPAPGPGRDDPVLRVLDHERRLWSRTTAVHLLPEPHDARLDEVVSAATLFGADDAEQAQALLRALPTFDGAGRDAVARYRRWLAATYPGPGALNPLRPDRLGEDLAAATLAEEPGLASAAAPLVDGDRLVRALTVLGRAAPRHPHVRDTMRALLTPDLLRRVPLAIAVATRVEDGSLVGVLSELLDTGAEDGAALDEAIVGRLPDSTLALAAFAVVRTRTALDRKLAERPPDPEGAAWLTHALARRLAAVGEHDEALVVAARAVRRYEAMDEHDVEAASALDTLAGAYGALGLAGDGLEYAEKAIGALRAAGTAEARDLLAAALLTHASLLGLTAEFGRAAGAAAEAVELLRTRAREAAGDDRTHLMSGLASALGDLAVALSEAGRPTEALPATGEAVGLLRELDAADPDRFRDDLVRYLGNLAGDQAALHRWPEAREAAREAVALARGLVARYGERHLDALAAALVNSAATLRGLGDHEAAIEEVTEAVGLYRELASELPGTQLANLAKALHNLGLYWRETGDAGGARDAFDESVDIYRKLSDPLPDAFEPELAEVLGALAGMLQDEGDLDGALAAAADAVAVFSALFGRGRAEVREKYVAALMVLAHIHHDLGRAGPVILLTDRAGGLLSALVAEGRADLRDRQAVNLHLRAQALEDDERDEAAAEAYALAAAPLRRIGDGDRLASVLTDLGRCLSGLGRAEEALSAAEEAVRIRRALPGEAPGDRVELANVLNNLADTLHDLGRTDEALPLIEEAVALCAGVHDAGGPEADLMYVCSLVTMARISDDRDPATSMRAVGRAARVALDLDDPELIGIARGAWAELSDEPFPGGSPNRFPPTPDERPHTRD